jgi:AcrR family transcriptional regulator
MSRLMPPVRPLRETYAENTRRVLMETALELFVQRGYPAVSAEELVQAAGLSRGALYHHFDGKRGLFEAVFQAQENAAAERIMRAIAAETDPWQQALAGMDTFLEVCCERDYREIVLLQGPIALGWRRWRELDRQYFAGLLLEATKALIDAGVIVNRPPELIAAAAYGMLTELSLTIAAADNQTRARKDASFLVRNLLKGIGADSN